MKTDKIKIAIAEDQTLLRQAIVSTLLQDKRLSVVCEAENGKQLVDVVEKVKPDVIILDIEMPVMGGFAVLDHLKFHYPQAHVIIVSMHFDNLTIRELVQKGARGFVPKNSDFESLHNAIYEVMSSGYFFSKRISAHLVQELLQKDAISPTYVSSPLTDTELWLLNMICQDKLLKEIAEIMGVSERTVERYKTELYKKTRVKTSAGLVLFAIQYNLFSPLKNQK